MVLNKKQVHLGVFLFGPGQHAGSWRHPATQSDRLLDIGFYQEFAKIAERGKFDTILVLEQLAIGDLNGKVIEDRPIPTLDTLTLLGVMAAVTEKIGLTATWSTTYNDPFHTAARFATIDHLSRGRAGWNMVTSQDSRVAFNYSKDAHMDHALRYQRAAEFVDVAKKVWDSWEEEAILADKCSGAFFDPGKVHDIHHKGAFFSVEGRSTIPRPIQGHPVLFQAGSSESGLHFAAQKAEVVFTAQDNLQDAQAYYAKLKALTSRYGRKSEQLHILPGLSPILGTTVKEAKELEAYFNELILPEAAVKVLSGTLDIDLSVYPIDGPLPYSEIQAETNNNKKSRVQLLKDLAQRENLSIRQLSKHVVAAGGHYSFVGTPEQLVDHMETWIDQDACDGFTIMPSHYLSGLEAFVDQVVPLLQEKGRHRIDYTGHTLREHLGLERPASPWTPQAQQQITL
ncbi:LLM class flavin-dependent oxidoreductase [Paenibacillus sp. SI8]|uniref:LLM class flavin-dependent oxidoreductase n=1 Tax=unclassified Paenibacillus TaxID=185978 RepID=UPI003465904D